MNDWFKRQWRKCVPGAAIVAIAIAAIVNVQPDVPVVDSPAFIIKSNTTLQLTADYAVTTSVGVVSIDTGYISDGASIPARVWSLLGLHPWSGCVIRAALVHDALCQGELCDIDAANRVFHELLLADGCQEDKARIMFEAVCLAGPVVWGRHTPESVAEARKWVRLKKGI